MKNDEEIKPTLRINIIIVISFLQSFMWKFYGTIINNIVLTFPSSCKIYKIRKKIDDVHYSNNFYILLLFLQKFLYPDLQILVS